MSPLPARLECQVTEVPPSGETVRWFVSSSIQDGTFYEVTLEPGRRLECSCPAGRLNAMRAEVGEDPKPCRHLLAVGRHVREQAEEVA